MNSEPVEAPQPEPAPSAPQAVASVLSPATDNKLWYVVSTYSGFEAKVKSSLEQHIKASGMEGFFGRILIPTEDVLELKAGKRKIASRKFFPGYILVEMEMNEDTWGLVRNVPRVSGFIGAGTVPSPISNEEIEEIIRQMEGVRPKPKLAVSFETGETVKIVEGPFTSFTGTIEDANEEKTRLRVMVTIFGRQTPVELDFSQVEKI